MREDTQMSMNVRLRTRRPGCSPGASGGSDSSGNVGDNFTPVQTGSAPVSHFPGHPEPFFWRAQSDCHAGPGFSSAPEPPGHPLCLSALGTQREGKGLGQVRPPPGRMAVPPAGKGGGLLCPPPCSRPMDGSFPQPCCWHTCSPPALGFRSPRKPPCRDRALSWTGHRNCLLHFVVLHTNCI